MNLSSRLSGVLGLIVILSWACLIAQSWFEPRACFATEESYDPLYTFELFL